MMLFSLLMLALSAYGLAKGPGGHKPALGHGLGTGLWYTWKVTRVGNVEYKSFFQTSPKIGVSTRWTLKVNTETFGLDFITFFATDHHRPLEYACAFSYALCEFFITKGTHDPTLHQTTVSAYLKNPVHLAAPSMSGTLMICTAPADFFWKRPLTIDGPLHPVFALPTTVTGNFFCQLIDPAVSTNLTIVIPPPPAIAQACDLKSFSCSAGAIVQPNVQASDKPELEVFVWYMTKENYREMRLGKTTQVFIPLFEEYYTLHLYGIISLPLEERCTVIAPSGDLASIEITNTKLNRLEYPIAASETTSGVYSVNCSIAFHDAVDGHNYTLVATKSLNITFIRGPKILLEGEEGFTKYFPPNATSSDIVVRVYTASPLSSFEVTQDGKRISEKLITSFLSNSPFDIVWRHTIRVPKLNYFMNGAYVIEVKNEDGETATQKFSILKAKLMTVLVSPVQISTEVGSQVTAECAVIGNLVEQIAWSRDIEDGIKSKRFVLTDLLYGEQESRGVRMTIQRVTMKDSGIYECRVSNKYQKIVKSIELIVWPRGGPYLYYNTSEYPIPPDSEPSGPTVLDIFEPEIIKEYRKLYPTHTLLQPQQQFLGILLTLIGAMVLDLVASISVIACYLNMRRKKRGKAFLEEKRVSDVDQGSETEELLKEETEVPSGEAAVGDMNQGGETVGLLDYAKKGVTDWGSEMMGLLDSDNKNGMQEDNHNTRRRETKTKKKHSSHTHTAQ